MSKVTINFKLPEEGVEYREAVHGGEWKAIVYEVAMFLRNKLKYGHEFKSASEALEATRDVLWSECEGVRLDPFED